MMNMRKTKGGDRRIAGRPTGGSSTKEDESLVLFGEMVRREKERNLSLLEPVSVEFERIRAAGDHNINLYKIPSGKRDFLAAEGEKNDYDWLKTPPATPLFPSLEMEANNNNIIDHSNMMILHKELPILRPLKPSRFSNKQEAAKTVPRSNSPTSSKSSSSSSSKPKTPKARAVLPGSHHQPSPTVSTTTLKEELNLMIPLVKPHTTPNPTAAKIRPNSSNNHPRTSSRGSVAAPKTKGFDNTALPNLIPNAPTTRPRPAEEPRGQPCSPGAVRGRKAEFRPESNAKKNVPAARKESCVEVDQKVMRNGRRERGGGEEKDVQRAKNGAQGKESLGFGSLVVPKPSLCMALKNSKDSKKKMR